MFFLNNENQGEENFLFLKFFKLIFVAQTTEFSFFKLKGRRPHDPQARRLRQGLHQEVPPLARRLHSDGASARLLPRLWQIFSDLRSIDDTPLPRGQNRDSSVVLDRVVRLGESDGGSIEDGAGTR